MRKNLWWAIFVFTAAFLYAEKSLDLGTISRLGAARTVPIYWEVKSEAIKPLVDRAMEINGGFLRVSPDNASVIAEYREIAGGKVELVIYGTKPKRVIYSEAFEAGKDGGKIGYLALRACNRAVEKILGIPGFYTGKLAFVSDRTGNSEVYISDLFFQNARQLTSDRSLVSTPKLSPDGRTLNYTSFHKTGYPDVFRIDLASGRRTVVSAFKGLNNGGSWAPAQDFIALILSSSGNPEVYITDPKGTRFKRLTHTNAIEASPSFSPDGQRMVFASDLPGKPQLYVMDVLGGPLRRVPTNISRYCAEPMWNPRDPNEIVFTVGVGAGFQVALYDFAKQQSKILTRESGDAQEPCWLSDGRHIIYTARSGSSRQLKLLDTQTGKTSALTSLKFGRAYQASFVK
jgi:TolB protein